MTTERFLDVWTDTISAERPCGDPACGKLIVFAELVKSGKRHPFVADYDGTNLGCSGTDANLGRHITRIKQSSSHFADCPASKRFSRRA